MADEAEKECERNRHPLKTGKRRESRGRGVDADPEQVDVAAMLSAEHLTPPGNAVAAHR